MNYRYSKANLGGNTWATGIMSAAGDLKLDEPNLTI